MNDTELGTRLRDLSRQLELPDVDLADVVVARIRADGRAPRQRRRSTRLAVAAAVVAAVVLAAVAFTPSREALARWFGIGATVIREVPPADLPTPRSRPDLGQEQAVPPGSSPIPSLGPPAALYTPEPGVRSFVWPASPALPALGGSDLGAVLTVRPAGGVPATKLVPSGAPVESVRVGDAAAAWIPGDHVLLGPDGTPTKAARVLLWVADGREYRLETNLDRDRAVQLGATVTGTAGG